MRDRIGNQLTPANQTHIFYFIFLKLHTKSHRDLQLKLTIRVTYAQIPHSHTLLLNNQGHGPNIPLCCSDYNL